MVRLLPWCLLGVSAANLISVCNEEDSSSLLQMQMHPSQMPLEDQHQSKASKLLLQVQEIASNAQDPVRQCRGGWRDGSGVGSSQQALGQAASQDACVTMVRQQCDDANAATYESVSGSCTCETGQTSLDASVTGSQNCVFFAGETTDANLRTAVDALDTLVDSIVTAMDNEHQSSVQILNTAFASVNASHTQITSFSATTIETKRVAAAEARATSDECAANLTHWTTKQAEDCPAWTGHAASLSSCSNACPCQTDAATFFSAFEVWEAIFADGGAQEIRNLKGKCDDANNQVSTLTANCPLREATAIQREAEYGEAAESHLQHCSSFAYDVEVYESVKQEVTLQQNQRRSEYDILLQVKCYIDAIEDSTNLSDQVVTQCAATEYVGQGASRYDITFHTVPESPTCLDVIRGFDGAPPGCFPLLLDFHLGNADNAPAVRPLNTGSFTSIRAVRKTGALSCNDQSSANPTVWNQCCGDSYREDCQGGFELLMNGQRVLEQATGSVLPNECDIPTSPAGDVVCQRNLQVAASDRLSVTWFETSRRHSTQNNVVNLVVDLYGCNTAPHVATPGWHLVTEDGAGEGHGCPNSHSQWCCGDDRTRILNYPSACSNGAPYHVRVETQDGNEWVEFKTDTCIFDGDLNDPNVDIYDVTSSNPTINDDSQFCKACSAAGTRWGDTCWGVVTDNYRQCGCNSGGWTGSGMYYGSWSNAEGPTACGPWPGSFSGFASNGARKGSICGKGMRILIHE